MKRVLLAGVGILALAASASAADLPRRYEPIPQRAAPLYAPIYNWTGFYIGINGGGAWGKSDWTSTGTFDVDGWMVGGTIGYNWQSSAWVFGLEGDVDWTNISGSTTTGCLGVSCQTKNTWIGTIRGRVGYAFDRFLPYLTGGVAFGNLEANQPGFSNKDTNAGWTVGGGLEFAIAGNWTAKAEYLYVDLGEQNCALSCGNGFNPDDVRFRTHIVRGGVNVRF